MDWFPSTPTSAAITTSMAAQAEDGNQPPMGGDMLLEDDFSDQSHWQTSQEASGAIVYEPSAISLAVSANKGSLTSLSDHILPGNFYLEITATVALCSPGDQYGLILWRNSVSGTFRVVANCQGELRVEQVLPTGTSRLVDWQSARKLQPGSPASNRFGVWANHGELQVFVNDTYQFTINTRSDLQGALGVFAQGSGEHAETIVFSELVISQP